MNHASRRGGERRKRKGGGGKEPKDAGIGGQRHESIKQSSQIEGGGAGGEGDGVGHFRDSPAGRPSLLGPGVNVH